MGRDVFISHSSHDREIAEAARSRLEARGYRCWVAPRDISPGQDYGAAIVEGIRGARLFLLIFSSRSNSSPQVKREVERAANLNLPIIPFRTEDVLPSPALEYFISGAHWLDAIDPPLDRHLDYLAEAVGRILLPKAAAPPSSLERPLPDRVRRAPGGRRSWWLAAGAVALTLLIAAAAYWLVGRDPHTEPGVRRHTTPTIFTRRAVPLPSARQLRLRAAPSEDAAVVRLIEPDEVFRIAPRNGEWWPARLRSGEEGFVAHRWIRVVDEEQAAPPAAQPGPDGNQASAR